jgi:hypothetical protein
VLMMFLLVFAIVITFCFMTSQGGLFSKLTLSVLVETYEKTLNIREGMKSEWTKDIPAMMWTLMKMTSCCIVDT